MHSTLRKFLTTFTVFFLLLFSTSTPVFADNDSDATPICTIYVNNVSLPYEGDAPEVPQAERAEGNRAIFPIRVQLNTAAQAILNNCGSGAGLIASTQSGGLQGWQDFTLTGSGLTFSGIINLTPGHVGSAHSAPIDVEVDPNNRGQCFANEPVCRRVYVKYDITRTENENLNCEDAMTTLIGAFNDSPSSVENGQSWSASVTLSEEVKDACNVDRIRYAITRLTETGSLSSGNSDNQLNISYQTSAVGQYVATLYTERLGQCPQFGTCLYEVERSTTKNFCVYLSGGDASCTPVEEIPDSQSEQIGAFSLCRQIPILTDDDITRQLENVPAAERVAAEADLKRRAAKQRTEKVACCQCTFGTREIDPNTGACRGEQGSEAANRVRQGFKPGLYTAVGCIGADSDSIVTRLVRIGLGIAGGVALLMILAGSFMFSTSQGDPKKASEAKELITSAVIGLVFIIFSVTLLQFIGVTILHLPGFGSVAQ